MKTLLRVGVISPEAGKMQQKELSIHRANGRITSRMKMPFDISSMVTKQDTLMVLLLLWRVLHLKTDMGIIDLYMQAGPSGIPL